MTTLQGLFSHSIHLLYKGFPFNNETQYALCMLLCCQLEHDRISPPHQRTCTNTTSRNSHIVANVVLQANNYSMRKERGFSFHQHTTPYAVCQNVTRFLSHVNGDRYNRHTSPESHHYQPTMTPCVPSTRARQRSARLHMYTYIHAVIAKLVFWILQTYTFIII